MDWHRIRKSYCHSDVSRLEFRKKIRELKRTKEKFSMLHSRPISSIWNRKCERGESGSCIYDTEEEPNARSRWSGLKYMYIYYLRLNLKADNKLDWSIFETVSIFDVHSMPFACHEIGERSTLSVDSFRLFLLLYRHLDRLIKWSAKHLSKHRSFLASDQTDEQSLAIVEGFTGTDIISTPRQSQCAAAIFMDSSILLTSFRVPATKSRDRMREFSIDDSIVIVVHQTRAFSSAFPISSALYFAAVVAAAFFDARWTVKLVNVCESVPAVVKGHSQQNGNKESLCCLRLARKSGFQLQ